MKHSSNVSKKTRLCFTCGSPRHLQSQCPQYTSTRASANQNLSKNQKHCSYDSTPYHSKAPNPPNDALKNVGFKPPGSYQTQRKYQFETDFESHFLVPARIRYVHRDLVSAVNDFHYAMMNDIDRNDFYYNMLKKAIKPGISTVLEIGPGSGLLSMIAATLGAKWVLAVEGSRDLAELARHNVAVNGFEDRVTIMHMMSTELRHHHMPNNELATILVSELFGTLLLGESALDYIAQVRAQPGILAKDCVILPRRGIQYAVPVSCPSLEILSKAYPYRGLHLEHMNALRDTSSCVFSKKYGFRLNSVPYKELSDPIEILKVDFAQDQQVDPLHKTQTVRMKQEGTVHAMILFWKAYDDLTGAAISTDAKDTIDNFARDMQWGQAIQLLDALDCDPVRVENRCERPQDLVVKQGDEMTLVTRASRDGVILQFSLFPAIEKV